MKLLQRFAIALVIITSLNVSAQNSTNAKMKTFIDALMKKMTLDEKIGQLNLPGAGDITTGGQASEDNSAIARKIKEGKVGGLFNIKGVEKITYEFMIDENRKSASFSNAECDILHNQSNIIELCVSLLTVDVHVSTIP